MNEEITLENDHEWEDWNVIYQTRNISMKGSVVTGDIEEDEDHMALTDTIDEFKYGKIDCIILGMQYIGF